MPARSYFDHNATTPVCPEAVEAMLPLLTEVYGNASSLHHFGQSARHALDDARRTIARCLGAMPDEIVFTSGGTEADNLAWHGHTLLTTTIEHPAVLAAPNATHVPCDSQGRLDPDDVRRAITPQTTLISVMHANNETGVIQPIEEIAAIAKDHGIPFHSDGVQAAGKLAIDCRGDLEAVSMYSISGHKVGAPKGIGALFVRKGTKVAPQLVGGKHERQRRAGTENVAGAAAMAAALQVRDRALSHMAPLRDHLEQSILNRIPDTHVNGAGAPRVSNTTNIRFDGIDSDALLIALDLRGFAVSSGAACSSGAPEPSHVLLAMGLTREQARSSIRFSLGRGNTLEEVNALVDATVEAVAHLRKLSPAYV